MSLAVLAAVTIADAHSSGGRFETNPLMRDAQGRFSPAKGLAIKAAAAGSLFAIEHLMVRNDSGMYKSAAVMNFASAAAFGAVAVRNHRVPKVE